MTIEDDIAFFERVPTLNLLGRQALRILAIGAQSRYVHGGEVLFNAGEEADGGFVVQEGRFRLAPPASADGRGPCGRALHTVGRDCAVHARASARQRPPRSNRPPCCSFRGRSFSRCWIVFPRARASCAMSSPAASNQSTQEISGLRAVLDAYDASEPEAHSSSVAVTGT